MRNYQKPNFDILSVIQKENLTSLNEWLQNAGGQEYQNAGVTTYVIES